MVGKGGSISAFAVDSLRGRIYWSDMNKYTITEATLHSSNHTVIVNAGYFGCVRDNYTSRTLPFNASDNHRSNVPISCINQCKRNEEPSVENIDATVLLPVTAERLQQISPATSEEPTLSMAIEVIRADWPGEKWYVPPAVHPYWDHRDELVMDGQLTFKGHRLVIHVHGIPDFVVPDNGSQFASAEFASFAKTWCFQHVTSSPHYAQSNGKAENVVKTVKRLFTKCKKDEMSEFLALFDWRNTQSEGMGSSPSQRRMGRRCKTLLSMAAPLHSHVILL
ncbi:hypothetical protein LSAT2_016131 [Lamellibrachia satsuma]|nr:hypothetical protein LSAT2_016131 [Lamellibrachia satsuma]